MQVIFIPYLILSCLVFICHTYFKDAYYSTGMATQQGDYAFSIQLKDANLHVSFFKVHHCFLHFVWEIKLYEWKVLPFGLAMTR